MPNVIYEFIQDSSGSCAPCTGGCAEVITTGSCFTCSGSDCITPYCFCSTGINCVRGPDRTGDKGPLNALPVSLVLVDEEGQTFMYRWDFEYTGCKYELCGCRGSDCYFTALEYEYNSTFGWAWATYGVPYSWYNTTEGGPNLTKLWNIHCTGASCTAPCDYHIPCSPTGCYCALDSFYPTAGVNTGCNYVGGDRPSSAPPALDSSGHNLAFCVYECQDCSGWCSPSTELDYCCNTGFTGEFGANSYAVGGSQTDPEPAGTTEGWSPAKAASGCQPNGPWNDPS